MCTKGMIGPHEGKELELMLARKKSIALFGLDLDMPEEFEPYIQQGVFLTLELPRFVSVNGKQVLIGHRIIVYPEYLPQAYLLVKYLHLARASFVPEYEREIGRLLGYEEQDIAYYIQHFQQWLVEKEHILTLA
ncbi:hypothetical protein [Pasteurella sp. PK-2025]|uniref:hypothetical protein n=1 Tax=Pasteurella sp. PK-2025 TaxID=3413133 RepID=UPI003C70CE3B